jgi:hypothetical protein
MFWKEVPTQDVTNPVSLPSFYCMQNVPFFLDYVILHFSHIWSNLTRANLDYGLYWSNALCALLNHGRNLIFSKADHHIKSSNKHKIQTSDSHSDSDKSRCPG